MVGGVDRGQRGVADDHVVAVAVAGVEGDDDIGTEALDDSSHLAGDERRLGGGQRSRRGLAGHAGVGVVEQVHDSDAENFGGRPQFGLAEGGEVVGLDAALAGLAAGGAQDGGVVAGSGGAGQDGSAPERLVVRVRDHDQQAHQTSSMPVCAVSTARRSRSGAAGCGRTRSVAGSPMPRKKSSRLADGLPEQITSIRAVSVRTRNVCAAPRATKANVPGVAVATDAVDLELDLAVEDVERLVLVDLDVHRRVRGRGHQVFREAVRAAGLGRAGHGGHERVEEPGRLALVAASDHG